jgi:anti-sigma B factor antagonist
MEVSERVMKQDKQSRDSVLRLQGEMTIYRAGELAQHVLAAVRQQARPRVDLSEVTEFDTSGIQILLMARRLAAAGEIPLQVVNPSECVRDVLSLCNLSHLVDAPAGQAA